jgi:hypothetical protein
MEVKGLKLTGTYSQTMHIGFAPAAYHELDWLDSNPTDPTQLVMWKVHIAHDREHDYHDSLHSAEVAQLCPQVGDFIVS